MNAALKTRGLVKSFGGERALFGPRRPEVRAVQGVDLSIAHGETLGIVGESGCGKSTLARMLAGLLAPSVGSIEIGGREVVSNAGRHPAAFGRAVQYVFQDPIAALNPRKTVAQILEAPLVHLHRLPAAERARRAGAILDAVNLPREALGRYPHEFSGGQAQRIGIARAFVAQPGILILDEPVSALDVSVQAQVLNLLADLKDRFGLTYLFISHDLAVVEAVADRVAVMYFGRIVETGPAAELFAHPAHPYTALLAASAPTARRPLGAAAGNGEAPSPVQPLTGCAFASRCPRASDLCRQESPPLAPLAPGREVACYHPP